MKSSDIFQSYKTYKVVQLILLVVFAIAFFVYLYADDQLRTSVYTNKSLLTICVFLWAFMIYSFISIIWDFHQLQKNIIDNHVLNRTAYLDNLTGIPNRNSCDIIFEKLGDGYGFVGRNGGNEFIAVLEHCSDEKMNSFIEKLTDSLDEYNEAHPEADIALSCHTALNYELGVTKFSELMRLLYNEAKKE